MARRTAVLPRLLRTIPYFFSYTTGSHFCPDAGKVVSAISTAVFHGFSRGFRARRYITEGARDCRRESETPLFPVSRACSILCPHQGSGHFSVRKREDTCKRSSLLARNTPRSWSRGRRSTIRRTSFWSS